MKLHEHDDLEGYYKYTGPSRLDKAMHTLEGMLQGFGADGTVSPEELRALTFWIGEHQQWQNRHPFNEVIPAIQNAIADHFLDSDERSDLLWLCEKLRTENSYYCAVTADIQRLHGIMGGIAADGVITVEELRHLQAWLDERLHLRTCWPYDEIEALVLHVLKDGVIDDKEHRSLLAFFSEFTANAGHRAVEMSEEPEELLVKGVCAVCPEVVFPERLFCFTGVSQRFTRSELAKRVEQLGGIFKRNVVQDLNYLVIGADGNPCWAYACYGRKVEEAVRLRRDNRKIVLVHEYDFWDALQDAGGTN